MTISTTINRKEYTGDGSSTSFSFPYFVIAAADLKVYQNGTLKTITTHYTLSGSAPYTSGTNVQFVTAPALADEIVIIRDPALTQTVDLTDNDPLPVASIENPLDRLTMIDQRLSERIDRSFTLSDTDVSGASTELPTPSASKLIGWDSAGMALANYASASIADTIVPTAFMETLLDDTSAAVARATLGAFASAGGTISGAVTVQGDVTLDTGKALIFEGATADAFETTLGVTDPTADRTILLKDGSGTLAFTSDIPTSEKYVLIEEQQTSGTAGGTFTSGSWQKRLVNTELSDASALASISSGVIALAAGTYRFRAHAQGYLCGFHKARLQDTTNAATLGMGSSELGSTSYLVPTSSTICGRFTIAGTTNIELQHQCQTTRASDGLGLATSLGTEVYARVEFWKEF